VTTLSFEEMTWAQVRELDSDRVVALLPVGALEAHGPHLPLCTDVIISVEMARRAAARLESLGHTALLLPPLCYTSAGFASGFAGTIDIDGRALQETLQGIARSLGRAGIRRVCLANSHLDPDHIDALRRAADSAGILFPDKTRRRWVQTLTEEFRSGSCHGGRYETSLVLAARPDLVRPVYKSLPPRTVDLAERIRSGGRSFEEAGMDQAYCGAPAEATREEGEKTYDLLADMIVTTLREKTRETER
jgi:creatinine amidohydrolase